MKKALALIVGIIIITSLWSCKSISKNHPEQNPQKNPEKIELVNYIGKPLSTVETDLSTELEDITQHFERTYRLDVETTLVDFTLDNNGKVIQIHLLDSGKFKYTLCGLTTEMDDTTAASKLSEIGAVHIREKVWQCSNKTDSISRGESGWIYTANSENLAEQLLLAKMEKSLTYQHEDSEGICYIGNHQFVEYYYSSFPKFVCEYKKLTEYQQSMLNETIAGRYVMVSGTVTGVSAQGTVSITCEDQSLDVSVGNALSTVSFAQLTLVPEQNSLLMRIAENSTIVAFGKIALENYNGYYFDLYDTIVMTVDSSAVAVPVIERPLPGITCFDSQGNLVIHATPPTEGELARQEAISALSDVLTSSELFCFVEEDLPAYAESINSIIQICHTEFPQPLLPIRFAVIDLDQDGTTEVIVELTNDIDGWELVLHYYNGTVYGYGFGVRSMQSVYANGVIWASSSAFQTDAYTIQFDRYALIENWVDPRTATEPVQWYDFTQENISMALEIQG